MSFHKASCGESLDVTRVDSLSAKIGRLASDLQRHCGLRSATAGFCLDSVKLAQMRQAGGFFEGCYRAAGGSDGGPPQVTRLPGITDFLASSTTASIAWLRTRRSYRNVRSLNGDADQSPPACRTRISLLVSAHAWATSDESRALCLHVGDVASAIRTRRAIAARDCRTAR